MRDIVALAILMGMVAACGGSRRAEEVIDLEGVVTPDARDGLGDGADAVPTVEACSFDELPASRGEPSGVFELDDFVVQVDARGGWIISHADEPGRALFQLPDAGDLAALQGTWTFTERQGAVSLSESTATACAAGAPERAAYDGRNLELTGPLGGNEAACAGLSYRARFCQVAPHRLAFDVQVRGAAPAAVRVRAALEADEGVYGLGEQFPRDTLDLRGRVIPVLVREQGIGRGEPAVSQVMEQLSPGSAGDEATTYAAAPHVLTSRGRSFFLENDDPSVFDLATAGRVEVRVLGGGVQGQVLHGRTPLELIERYTEVVGRMRQPPAWLDQGAVVALARDLEEGAARAEQLLAHGARLAGVWNQTWCGTAKTLLGEQVLWNWALPPSRRDAWGAWVEARQARGARVLCYVNPMLRDLPDEADPASRNLYREAVEGGLVITQADGTPYLLQQGVFQVALLDLSSPAARAWMKAVLKDELLGTGRCSGWMADFAEALPFDAHLASGEPAAEWHNRYPVEWARLNREALEEAGRLDDALVFHRSGFTTTPAFAGMLWEGDQTVTWDRFDGLRSALHGLLNGGLSGFALNHPDAGGYTVVPLVDPPVKRSPELLMRWVELAAFTSLLRTHEGNQPGQNAQVYSSEALLEHFARFSRVYRALGPYRRVLFADAAAHGWPVVRTLAVHYPELPRAWEQADEFLLGPDVLVAPILEPSTREDGGVERALWLPPGRWQALWNGEVMEAPEQGRELTVTSLPGFPPVFLNADSAAATGILAALQADGLLQAPR
jgi:alpha-glucosidase